MFRNIYYDRKTSVINHWLWDDDGNPIERRVKFKPYLYIRAKSDKDVVAYGIDGASLAKKEFINEWERKKYVEDFKHEPVYLNLPPAQQYLLENYYKSDIQELTKNELRTFFFDIEVISDEFPDPKEAKFPITSITIFDTLTKKYYVWGIKPFNVYTCKDHLTNIEPEDIVYDYCPTEKMLLKHFLRFWRKNFPDLLVGYNSYSFDMPYIVHRIEQLFGMGKASVLSPVDNIYGMEKDNKKFGRTYTEYTIAGVSHLDYMILYKTFTPGERESDSLDYVCIEELGEGKLDYAGDSLNTLFNSDWDKFINYNIWDVRLLIMLDEKRKYLNVAKFSAFGGFCNLDKALGKVAIITGVLAKQAMLDGRMISTQRDGVEEGISGGYVKSPAIGIHENIMSFDISSLYPSAIISLNISPETKLGKITSIENGVAEYYNFKDKRMYKIPTDKFKSFLIANNYALSKAGILFEQNVKGVCSKFVDELYQRRKSVKEKMKNYKDLLMLDKNTPEYKQAKFTYEQLDTEQYLYKILLNSTYGVLANRFFPLYDIDCAKSITKTGQELIKHAEKTINKFITEHWDLEPKDRVKAGDTDSQFFSFDDIIKKLNIQCFDAKGNMTPEMQQLDIELSSNINDRINTWAIDEMNSADPRFEFKREYICAKVLWLKKKHYIMDVRYSENIKENVIKYKGLSVVKSTYSKEIKTLIKDFIKGIMRSANKKESDEIFFNYYELFGSMPLSTISVRTSVKTFNKWGKLATGMNVIKRTPMNVKYSVYHNELLNLYGIQNKYPAISNGMKIKMFYVKPNRFNIEGIAFGETFPSEFELQPDIDRMFDICVINCLRPIYDALEWNIPDPKKQYDISLEELFA